MQLAFTQQCMQGMLGSHLTMAAVLALLLGLAAACAVRPADPTRTKSFGSDIASGWQFDPIPLKDTGYRTARTSLHRQWLM